MAYPATIDTFTPVTDNVDDAEAADINPVYTAITATQTELGADVAGTATSLVTRLARSISAAGLLNFEAPSTLTIAAGSVTLTKNLHVLDTESAAATDDLDTITAGADGQVVFLTIASSARNVVIRHNVGNIVTPSAGNITLDLTSDFAIGIYSATLSKWIVGAFAWGLASSNTWTAIQYFAAAVRYLPSILTTSITLDATYNRVLCNATAGALTETLPPAATFPGIEYHIVKTDASANTVTIEGDGAETINGALTKVLSNQYSSATVYSTGTEWLII